MKHIMIVTAAVAVVALSGSLPAFAQEGDEPKRENMTSRVQQTVESNVTRTEDGTRHVAEDTTGHVDDKLLNQQERIEAHKAELQKRMEQKAAERKEKLEGRRLAVCQKRQDNINSLIKKSADTGEAKLARIQAFAKGITTFYAEQGLSSDKYAAALEAVEEEEIKAMAALSSMTAQPFDCTSIDGAKPSDTIKSAHETKRTALKDYRTSVQDLLKVVRLAFAQKSEAPNETE